MRDAIGKIEWNKARGSYSATLLSTTVGFSLVIRPLTRCLLTPKLELGQCRSASDLIGAPHRAMMRTMSTLSPSKALLLQDGVRSFGANSPTYLVACSH